MYERKREELHSYLKSSLENATSWIYRKEIAAWSSVLLYFTALFGISSIIKGLHGNIGYSIGLIGFVVLFGYLFGVFLHKQYGSLITGLAAIRALSYWLITVIKNKCEDIEFDFTISSNGQFVSIRKKIDEEYDQIRRYRMRKKFFIPFYLFWNLFRKKGSIVNHIDNVEVQESVLYDMILLSTVLLVGYILINTNFCG
jgi:hypothetical protein